MLERRQKSLKMADKKHLIEKIKCVKKPGEVKEQTMEKSRVRILQEKEPWL